MKIKIKNLRNIEESNLPKIIKKGDWIDLRACEDYHLKAPLVYTEKIKTEEGKTKSGDKRVKFQVERIPLGVAMKLPKGFEAVVVARSSNFRHYGCILSNHFGVIDNSYRGNGDEWGFEAIALNSGFIRKGDKICQFRIQLSQKANFWQKLRWLLSSRIKLKFVDSLGKNPDRGGFGSTGKN